MPKITACRIPQMQNGLLCTLCNSPRLSKNSRHVTVQHVPCFHSTVDLFDATEIMQYTKECLQLASCSLANGRRTCGGFPALCKSLIPVALRLHCCCLRLFETWHWLWVHQRFQKFQWLHVTPGVEGALHFYCSKTSTRNISSCHECWSSIQFIWVYALDNKPSSDLLCTSDVILRRQPWQGTSMKTHQPRFSHLMWMWNSKREQGDVFSESLELCRCWLGRA